MAACVHALAVRAVNTFSPRAIRKLTGMALLLSMVCSTVTLNLACHEKRRDSRRIGGRRLFTLWVSYDYSYLRFSVFLVRVQPVSQLVICFAGVRISEIRPFLPKAASPSDLFPTLPQFDMSHMRAGQAFYQMPV